MNVGTLGMCLGPPPARGGDKSQARMCRVLMAGFSWQGSHDKSPLRRGGAVSGKAPDGARTWDRGNKSRAGFSLPRGDAMQCAIAVTDRIFKLFKRGSLSPIFCLPFGTGVTGL